MNPSFKNAIPKPQYAPKKEDKPFISVNLNKSRERAEESLAAEIERIISLPVMEDMMQEELAAVSAHYLHPRAKEYGFNSLLRTQADAVKTYFDYEGGFLPIAVGGGKTLTGAMVANDAYIHKGHKKIITIVPSSLVEQLVDTDIPLFRKILWDFNLHVHVLSGCTPSRRSMLAQSNRQGLYIFTYELLSRAGGLETLEAIKPSLIICDEAHNIAGVRRSARSKRFWEYVNKYNPQVVAMSGTITKKSPADYFRIARACLKDNNFLPNASTIAEAWGALIDSGASNMSDFRNDNRPKAGPIMPLVHWARKNFPEAGIKDNLVGFREAYKYRLRSCPGVVSSGDDELGVSLRLDNNPVEDYQNAEGWDTVTQLVDKLTNEWLTPNDDEIEHAMHIWKWRYEIEGSGFYNELFWPEEDVLSKRKGISLPAASDIIERSQEYHASHQDFARELRKWLEHNSRPGLDSPMLVGGDMSRNGSDNVGALLYDTWRVMKGLDFKDRIDRDARAVRVSAFKINHCADYVEKFKKEHKREGMIVWHHHQEMGRWLCEVLTERGIDVVRCAAGPQFNSAILDPKNRSKVIVASLRAHGTGKNLQAFGQEYYLQWPRDAVMAEQSLGRIHRNGQKREEVQAILCNTTEFDEITFSATLNDSCYIHQTIGNKQRLMYADYTFKPKIVPYAVMAEWGTKKAQRLDSNAVGALKGKFGLLDY